MVTIIPDAGYIEETEFADWIADDELARCVCRTLELQDDCKRQLAVINILERRVARAEAALSLAERTPAEQCWNEREMLKEFIASRLRTLCERISGSKGPGEDSGR